jgi:C-type mannose receptor
LLLLASVTGCPLTDDYFIQPEAKGESGSGGASALPSGGSSDGGRDASGGSLPTELGGSPAGGDWQMADAGSRANEAGDGSGGTPACVPTTERCNGWDDDCDDVIDEEACNSTSAGTFGCSGFVIGGKATHGYMFCNGQTREYDRAQSSCQAQGMRLAWLESKAENDAVWAKVNAIQSVAEVWIGASDREMEGRWYWDGQGGSEFWDGDANGSPVAGAFVAWAADTPNNSQGTSQEGEDCAVLVMTGGTWGDRTCSIKYAYLCEDVRP